MSSPFDALIAQADAAAMASFGETQDAMLRPRTRSEFAEGADSLRPARPIRGVFSDAPAEALPKGNATGAEFKGVTRMSVQKAEFWLSPAVVAAIPYRIATGDQIEFPARPGAPVYAVSDLHETNAGDLNLILVKEGGT